MTLELQYDMQQACHHPDLHLNSPQSQAMAQEKTLAINQAFVRLKNPAARLKYLVGERHKTPSQETLLRQFHLLEKLDPVDPLPILTEIYQEIQQSYIKGDLSQQSIQFQDIHFILCGIIHHLEKSQIPISYYDKILCQLFLGSSSEDDHIFDCGTEDKSAG